MIKIEDLRQKRIEFGITQNEISEALGITRAYVCACERGIRKPSGLFLVAYEYFIKNYKKNEKSC